MVKRWNGGMDACVVSSTFLVHVGNNCIGSESLSYGEMKFWHERYLYRRFCCQTMHAATQFRSIMDQGIRMSVASVAVGSGLWSQVHRKKS